MKNEIKSVLALLILIGGITSCHKDQQTNLPTGKGVYIINEGLFNWGNAEISFYNPNTNETSNNLFESANGYSLGDVAQSMYIKDSLGFIVVNNSAKVEVVKIPSLQHIRTISLAGASPRYILPVNDSIAYVSEIYANKIWVVNYVSGYLVTQISMPQYTEHLVKIDEYVFAEGKKIYSNLSAKGALFRIRISDHTLLDQKQFAGDADGIVRDGANHICILTGADSATSTPAKLLSFNKNFDTVFSYSFSAGVNPKLLSIDESSNELIYVIDKNVFRATDNTAFISSSTSIYSIGISPINGDVYLSDALDFVQSSKIFRYNKNGTLIHSFTTGIISGNFAFNE